MIKRGCTLLLGAAEVTLDLVRLGLGVFGGLFHTPRYRLVERPDELGFWLEEIDE